MSQVTDAGEPGRGASAWRAEDLSDLIGQIYDCAIEPDRWPQTIKRIAEATDCFAGLIAVADIEAETSRTVYSYGYPDGCLETMAAHTPDFVQLYRTIPDPTVLYDQPISSRRSVPPEMLETSPYLVELNRRYGIVDSIDLFLIAERDRMAELGLSRHESQGYVTDEDLGLLALLAPHVRRAVTISDLLAMKAIEADALGATLDNFEVGVVIVDWQCAILHANALARRMMDHGGPIAARAGRLVTQTSSATADLAAAVETAGTDEAKLGTRGIGVALSDAAGREATAHVLPLAGSGRRALLPRAAAAVFVMSPDAPAPDVSTVARMYGLTRAEARLLAVLATGVDVDVAARLLGVSLATARTHRTRIFAKMDVSGRADLLAILMRLIPPVAPPQRDPAPS